MAAAQTPVSFAPAGWDTGLRLADLRDTNADPTIVEVDMTARLADVEIASGHVAHAWTYNGAIPGPLIRAHVGDRVIVHFRNDLPQPMAWKDTLNVPMQGTIRFLVVFDERPGMWMFHCHILDHADGGLMGHVQVGPASTADHAHVKQP